MTPRNLALVVAAVIVVAVTTGFVAGRRTATPTTLTKTEWKTIEKQVFVPKIERLPSPVIERVKVVTKTVEVPVEVVREVSRLIEQGPVEARITTALDKLAGVDEAGVVRFGWKGTAGCQVRQKGQPDDAWLTLATAPIDLEGSQAVTVPGLVPKPLARWSLDVALGGGTDGWVGEFGVYRRLGRWPVWVGVRSTITGRSGFLSAGARMEW